MQTTSAASVRVALEKSIEVAPYGAPGSPRLTAPPSLLPPLPPPPPPLLSPSPPPSPPPSSAPSQSATSTLPKTQPSPPKSWKPLPCTVSRVPPTCGPPRGWSALSLTVPGSKNAQHRARTVALAASEALVARATSASSASPVAAAALHAGALTICESTPFSVSCSSMVAGRPPPPPRDEPVRAPS